MIYFMLNVIKTVNIKTVHSTKELYYWKKLPEEIYNSDSLIQFKQKLRASCGHLIIGRPNLI